MIRSLLAVLMILIGLVGVAAGIWGIYTVNTIENMPLLLAMSELNDLKPQEVKEDSDLLLQGSQAVLNAADVAFQKIDEVFLEHFDKSPIAYLNGLVGDEIDLTNELDVKLNLCRYRIEILLAGIILMQTGMLMWVCGRRR